MLQHLKIVTNEHQHAKTIEDEEVYILNKCSESNCKTKTEIPPPIKKIMVQV